MPNKDLNGKQVFCPILDKKLSYENMKKMKSFFDNYDGDETDVTYKEKGGEKMKNWLDKTLTDLRNAIYYQKKSMKDVGMQNQFKKTHTKDTNPNPTKVRIPKIAKSSTHDYIMMDKTVYESLDKEIKDIKYLIEYLDNKKTIK